MSGHGEGGPHFRARWFVRNGDMALTRLRGVTQRLGDGVMEESSLWTGEERPAGH